MANRYWVGGAGNWSSTTKWSTTSGGASGASVPTSVDDAIFDANSGGKFTATVDTAQSVYSITITPSAAVGVQQIALSARLTTNNLTTTGTAGNNRIWFRGNTYGIAQDFVVNGTVSISDCDFRDIYVIGTAAPISGTRIGDLRGIRGITASTPKTVYWNLAAGGNWSATAWAATSGGAVSTDNFPLAQDTAVIENTGLNTSATVTVDSVMSSVAMSGVDMSTRTNAMTFATGSVTFFIYGDWKNGAGTTLSGTGAITFSGRNTQTITSAGKTFTQAVTTDSYGGTVQLADALNIGSNTLTVTNGTFSTQNYNVTAGSLSSSNSNVRTITLGSSTVTLTGQPVTFTTSTNLTFNAGTSTLSCAGTTITFNGGGQTFYDVEFTNTGTTIKTVAGANTFRNLVFTAPTSAGIQQRIFSDNQTITGTLTVAGATAVRRGFLFSPVLGTTRTLTVNSLSADDCDFRDITIAGAAAGSSPTRAGDCGGNTGITFPAAKTVYWNLAGTQNWSATAWATTSGGTPALNNFPLAQDTAVFNNAGSVDSVSVQTFNIGTFDASTRTSAMTLTGNTAPVVYGDWKFGTGVTSSTTSIILFSGRGASSITSNGVTFNGGVTIDSLSGTVQLADALMLASNRTLTLTSGTFDAVTYNVTTGRFDASVAGATLKMGSGTWTLSGTGSVWAVTNSLINMYKGTANIVLSDTSTSARTFGSGGTDYSYNKLTIGGATGTSTLTINGNNQFTELASTKTVAHTIALGTTTQTFGAWTVTGTAGNVVTLTGTGTSHILAGACTSGIDYLAMGSIGFAATSPGEFYAGANSTGTAAAPVYRTAKPADSTRYWVGGTGNWSDTARWSTSSGGASGASVPRSHDDVVFNSASNATAYTATVNTVTGGIRMKALTVAGPASGNLTLAGSTAIVGIHGDVTLPATGLTRTYTGGITLSGSATGRTFTTNGVTLASDITINGVDCGWSLGSALNIGSATFTSVNGAFDAASYNLTAGNLLSYYGNSRSLDFDTGTISLSGASPISFGTTETSQANLTFTAATSQINCTTATVTFSGNNQTFHNVAFTSTSAGTVDFNGANTFNNLSFTGITAAGLKVINLSANQTITDTLSFLAGTNATMRTFVRSDTLGTTRTLTCANFVGTDVDFRDITIAGAAAPVSGTRLGDCKGNSGITFPAGVTRYWNLVGGGNWSGTGWAATSGGSPAANNFPLAQDTALFEATGLNSGSTITVNAAYNIGTIDMSARTNNTMTLATGTTTPSIYGNWINGTGTTLTGTGAMTFAGRGSQTITSAGRTFTQSCSIQTPGGSVTLLDAFVSSRSNSTNSFFVASGTLDDGGYNFTLSGADAGIRWDSLQTGAGTRAVVINGTWSIGGTLDADPATGLTVSGAGTISLTSASSKTFFGGSISYSGITLNQGGAGTLSITGNNTFANISNTYKATGATTINMGTTTQTVGNFTASGEAGRVLTVQGSSAASPATLVFTGSGQATTPTTDYLAITGVRAYDLTTTWYAGANSTNNGSLGWYFEAGAGGPIAVFIKESSTASDAQSASATVYSAAVETTTASDAAAAGLVYLGTLSESATASDVVEAFKAYFAAIAEAATSADLISASLTFASTVSELTTASDETAVSSRVSFPTVAELIAAADSISGGLLFATDVSETTAVADAVNAANTAPVSVLESSTAADSETNTNTTSPTVAESANALDSETNTNATNPTISEAAQISDMVSGGLLFLSNIAEATTAQEIAASVLIFNRAVAEATTASEVLAAVAAFQAAVPEQVVGADVLTTLLTAGSAINEALTALDSVLGPKTTSPTIVESAAASEVLANVYAANPAITETAQGTDATQVIASTFGAVAAEATRPLDSPQAANTGASSLSESAAVSETGSTAFAPSTAISEQATAQEVEVATAIFQGTLAEAAAAQDQSSVAPSNFSAVALAVAQAVDSQNAPGSTYNAALPIQGAGITDSFIGAYLWNPIPDDQTPNWAQIANSQTPVWSTVDDSQTPNWQNIPNPQGSGWILIPTDDDPNWQPTIEP